MAKPNISGGDILGTLGDFTSKENWDEFFSIRGSDDAFEWYAEWPDLQTPLLSQLSRPESLQILVPGCGNSTLSENLYDAGFHGITNIDFSKVVISDMLRRNIRVRPDMRWRVMDMTSMQFPDESFDAIVDKGGLDALMEPELGPKLGAQYTSEVKRIMKSGGKFVCLTLAESHVLGLLFSKFRLGWRMNVHAIPHKPSNKPTFRTFMVVVEEDRSTMLHQITCSFDLSSLDCDKKQGRGLTETLESENRTRRELSSGADILHSLGDLQLGAGGDLKELIPGRRLQLTLSEDRKSRFSYRAVLLDAQHQSDEFTFHCGVFLVPQTRSHEWLFSSEEGQWLIVETSKAARLIMVLLDSTHYRVSIEDIKKDLSPLVKNLAPGDNDEGPQIPFMMANDGVKEIKIVDQFTSDTTGTIIIEDVIYDNDDGSPSDHVSSKDMTFRRLTFQRSLSLVQSEALLTKDLSSQPLGERDRRKTKSRKKVGKRSGSSMPSKDESKKQVKVVHEYLASSYHIGIVSGLTLIYFHLQKMASSRRTAKTVIIGLGAGLLPMFLHVCMPCLDIEVVELDPLVVRLASDYFGFIEDKQLKVHVTDGIQFVKEAANVVASSKAAIKHESDDFISSEELSSSNGNRISLVESKESTKIDLLIIDVDSSDTSSGMSCPHPEFLEEHFLVTVKESLSEGGLFVINLVSRSPVIRESVVSRIKSVFKHLYCLQIEKEVNLVLFAQLRRSRVNDDSLAKAALELQKLLKLNIPAMGETIMDTTKNIKCLQ